MLADLGHVVPTGDAPALAKAWLSLLNLSPGEKQTLGAQARARVLERYTPDRAVESFQAVYTGML
jgi:glycosyltransferase involved in cell wall biosynthesis